MTRPPASPDATPDATSLTTLLAAGDYLSYAYAYPHKTAYRPLSPAIPLREAWRDEDRSALFLYVHVPFCEQRCGFCNLYTVAQPRAGLAERFVTALERQAAVVRDALPDARFARLAIGGGTPTFLGAALLDRVFGVVERMGALGLPSSVEVSPGTLDAAQADVLAARRVTRVSVGVQSVVPAETSAVLRRQSLDEVERAFALLADRVPVRNVDVIYGLPGQTAATLRQSIDHLLGLGANELYLYPLYVRPLTGLGRRGAAGAPAAEDPRRHLYRAGRAHLLERGWTQVSMRMFRAPGAPDTGGPVYRCQDDGMVGLGAGARSYTRGLHYASPFAVAQQVVREQVATWSALSDAEFAVASHGIALTEPEQRRRYLLLTLLEGAVGFVAYTQRFGTAVTADFPELGEAVACGLVVSTAEGLALTELGRERSDVLGFWLQSPAILAARAAWRAA